MIIISPDCSVRSHGIALHRPEAHELRGLLPVQRQTVDPEAGGGAQGVLVQHADPWGMAGNEVNIQKKRKKDISIELHRKIVI